MTFRVFQLVISKMNNDIAIRLYYNVGTVSQTVRSGSGPYIGENHACPALLTVFSTTQLEHSITQCDLCHYGFVDAYRSPEKIEF
jgi:hypothetical protein